jgi:hypothetical protein
VAIGLWFSSKTILLDKPEHFPLEGTDQSISKIVLHQAKPSKCSLIRPTQLVKTLLGQDRIEVHRVHKAYLCKLRHCPSIHRDQVKELSQPDLCSSLQCAPNTKVVQATQQTNSLSLTKEKNLVYTLPKGVLTFTRQHLLCSVHLQIGH